MAALLSWRVISLQLSCQRTLLLGGEVLSANCAQQTHSLTRWPGNVYEKSAVTGRTVVDKKKPKRVTSEHWQCERKRKTDRESTWVGNEGEHYVVSHLLFTLNFVLTKALLLKSPFLVHAPKKQWRLKRIILLWRIWQPSLNAHYRINNMDLEYTNTDDIFHMRWKRIFPEHTTKFICPNAFNFVYFKSSHRAHRYSTCTWCFWKAFWSVCYD